MITRLEIFPEEFLGYDIFATKIECDWSCYSQFDFAQFFKATDNNIVTAVISLIDGFMCISNKSADIDQLKEFINFLNPKGIMCDSVLAEKLNIRGKTLNVMERHSSAKENSCFLELNSATDVFNELSSFANDELDLPSRDNFISDFSFKQRRNLSLAVSNGKAVAAAFAIGKVSAYIGAVATDKNYRQNGFGTKVLETLIFKLKRDKVYLFCEESKVEFYKKSDFFVAAKATVFNMGE